MKLRLEGLPRWFILPAFLAIFALLVPLLGMLTRVPWSHLGSILTSREALDALWLSLKTCFAATLISLVLGTPLALIFARAAQQPARPWWLTPARAFVLVPLVMPPVVAGLALLTTFGRNGVLGPFIESSFGITIPFTTFAVVMAQVFVSLPYLIITVETAARAAGSHLEHAAASLGASRWIQFSRITVPLLGPSLASGGALAFARSLGEFGATITFAGSMQGTTRTLPLEVYLQREQDSDTALALSLILIALALILTTATTWLEARNMRRFTRDPSASHSPGAPATRRDTDVGANHTPPRTNTTDVGASTPGWSLDANVPQRGVKFTLNGPPGSVVAIIGPNGAGKSTAVRLLAGDLDSPQSTSQTTAPVGFLDQSPSLFPHMSVLNNVAFGPRCHGMSKAESIVRAQRELNAVGLAHLEAKAPWQLSGGQAQRVALARMLAVDPQLLLLDEPFAALDQSASTALRSIVRDRLSRGLTAVVVTHDLLDVVSLATHVAVLESGALVATGPTTEIIAKPPNTFVARFAGTNMFTGIYHGGTLTLPSGHVIEGTPDADLLDGEHAAAIFSPTAVALRHEPSNGSPRNVLKGSVLTIDAGQAGIDVSLNIGADHPLLATVTAESVSRLGISPEGAFYAEIKAVQVNLIQTTAQNMMK